MLQIARLGRGHGERQREDGRPDGGEEAALEAARQHARPLLPLREKVPEGGMRGRRRKGRCGRRRDVRAEPTPSSVIAARCHLLPQGGRGDFPNRPPRLKSSRCPACPRRPRPPSPKSKNPPRSTKPTRH